MLLRYEHDDPTHINRYFAIFHKKNFIRIDKYTDKDRMYGKRKSAYGALPPQWVPISSSALTYWKD